MIFFWVPEIYTLPIYSPLYFLFHFIKHTFFTLFLFLDAAFMVGPDEVVAQTESTLIGRPSVV